MENPKQLEQMLKDFHVYADNLESIELQMVALCMDSIMERIKHIEEQLYNSNMSH